MDNVDVNSEVLEQAVNAAGQGNEQAAEAAAIQQPASAVPKTFTEQEVSELTQKLEAEREQAVSEALKKAKMTKDEAAAYEHEQKLKLLEEKERALVLKELQADTKAILAEKGLPADMLEFLIADSKENTQKRIDTFKAAYDKAVQEGIVKAIAGKTPPAGSAGAATASQSGFLQAVLDNQSKRG